MLAAITSGLFEVASTERQSTVRTVGGVTIASAESGMFTVRRKIEVSAKVEEILAAILMGSGQIVIDGIKIGRPKSIQVTMTEFKRWVFSPAFPVSVSVMGIDVSTDIGSIELIQDGQNGPALLVTTASSVKPDLLIGFTLKVDRPEILERVPDESEVATEFERHKVPAKHRAKIREAVGAAWGPKQIAPIRMAAVQGSMNLEGAEKLARVIVQELVDQKVVSAGLFFWMQLGYWMIKIIAALIQARRGT